MAIDYQRFLNEALLGAVRKVLIKVQQEGLRDENHFFISFQTTHPDVILSPSVKRRYPKEITIVLQNQFENLYVAENLFTVKLKFDGIAETITIPFTAITSFFDPSVHFMLKFNTAESNNLGKYPTKNIDDKIDSKKQNPVKTGEKMIENEGRQNQDNVIILDKFRNKNKSE